MSENLLPSLLIDGSQFTEGQIHEEVGVGETVEY